MEGHGGYGQHGGSGAPPLQPQQPMMMDPNNVNVQQQQFYYPQQTSEQRIGGDGEEVYGNGGYPPQPPQMVPNMMPPPGQGLPPPTQGMGMGMGVPPPIPQYQQQPLYDPYGGYSVPQEDQYQDQLFQQQQQQVPHYPASSGDGVDMEQAGIDVGGLSLEDNRRTGDGEEVYGYNSNYNAVVPPMISTGVAQGSVGRGIIEMGSEPVVQSSEQVEQELENDYVNQQDSQPVSLSSVDQGSITGPQEDNNRRTGDGEEVYVGGVGPIPVIPPPTSVPQSNGTGSESVQSMPVGQEQVDQESLQSSNTEHGGSHRGEGSHHRQRRKVDGETAKDKDDRKAHKGREKERDRNGGRDWESVRRDSSSSLDRRSPAPREDRRNADGGTRKGRDDDDSDDHRRGDKGFDRNRDKNRRVKETSRRYSSSSSLDKELQESKRTADGGSRRGRDKDDDRDYRDRDYEDYRSGKRRGGGREDRDRNRDHERTLSRREFETSRDPYRRSYRRDYDYGDDYDRPPSRSSYFDDEYYSGGRRRRRDENDSYRRGPPSEYNASIRNYPRDSRAHYGEYSGPMSSSFGPPSVGRPFPSGGFDSYAGVPTQAPSLPVYLATFRTQSPAQYREWYKKYLVHCQDPNRFPFPIPPGFTGVVGKMAPATENSRPPSQDGRSSVAGEGRLGVEDPFFKPIGKETREPTPPPARNTPLMFTRVHAIGRISALGYVVRNRDGSPNVELISVKSLVKRLPEYREVKAFPGPLLKDVTHKNTIIQFCQRKIRELEVSDTQVDMPNLILLWELLILLLRQNGSAVGSDIAELLLKSKSLGQSSETSLASSEEDYSGPEDEHIKGTRRGKASNHSPKYRSTDNDQKCVDLFCEKLLFGHKREALEYAMDNALWGHALFFASKMDEKLYGNVLARFANSTMSLRSPLQTLYHVLCGKQPPSVACCGDENFGDWKPHLAMILSNMGQRPEFEANVMMTMGKTLAGKGLRFAAQFCYLMAECEFAEDSDMGLLLGYNPSTKNILEATQMTEIYEFARSLANPDFTLGTSYILSKLEYTKQLLNLGLSQEAYAYCEAMTSSLKKNRLHSKERGIAKEILYYSERLVNCDVSRGLETPLWIEDLKRMADQLESESTSRKQSLTTSTISDHIDNNVTNQPPLYYQPSEHRNSTQFDSAVGTQSLPSQAVAEAPSVQMYNANGIPDNINPISNTWQQPPLSSSSHYSSMPSQDNFARSSQESTGFQPQSSFQDSNASAMDNNNYWTPQQLDMKYNAGHSEPPPAPKTTQVPSSYEQNSIPKQPQPTKTSAKKKEDSSKTQKKGGGILSGIFGAFSFKPKNQMILPDDKDPSIVWDESTKSWKNVKDDEDESSAPKGPPPKDSELMGMPSGPPSMNPPSAFPPPSSLTAPGLGASAASNPGPNPSLPNHPIQQQPSVKMNGGPLSSMGMPPAAAPNKFQRPKGLKLRNNYVDVFSANANSQQKAEEPKVPLSVGQPPAATGLPNIFMPPPAVADSGPINFLTPSSETEATTENGSEAASTPTMFNPAQFQQQQPVPNFALNR